MPVKKGKQKKKQIKKKTQPFGISRKKANNDKRKLKNQETKEKGGNTKMIGSARHLHSKIFG
jgi:hypothetical protein